jgi:anti-sigma regulatory factor (Ser/Thr protein kinase)
LVFTVEDHAPAFDPLAPSAVNEIPAPTSIDRLQVGGQGIRLMRKFAGTLAYQRLPDGNRLTIGFALPR